MGILFIKHEYAPKSCHIFLLYFVQCIDCPDWAALPIYIIRPHFRWKISDTDCDDARVFPKKKMFVCMRVLCIYFIYTLTEFSYQNRWYVDVIFVQRSAEKLQFSSLCCVYFSFLFSHDWNQCPEFRRFNIRGTHTEYKECRVWLDTETNPCEESLFYSSFSPPCMRCSCLFMREKPKLIIEIADLQSLSIRSVDVVFFLNLVFI